MTPPDWQSKLLAAASSASEATTYMLEAARGHQERMRWNLGEGQTFASLADSLRLVIEANGGDAENQLYGALVKYLEERG